MMRKGLLFLGMLFLGLSAYSSDGDSTFVSSPSKEFRPEIGVGLGVYQVFSDLSDAGTRNALTNPLVYSLYVSRRVHSSFDLGLRFSTGGMIGQENGPERYLNFKTVLHEGALFLSYNFSNFFQHQKILKPYLNVGLSVFEYNNKGDLYDANGNYYHYWSDGTIRNVGENDPSAAQSQIIRRDYVYETDLRKANLDGFGIYRQVGFGLPIGVEFEFNITDRMSFRLGGVYTFSFTDYLDNVTESSVGGRAGSKGGDHFLQYKMSLHYDFYKKLDRRAPRDFEFVDFLALDVKDDDKDGIINEFDQCPYTIKDVKVDAKGCPLDLDNDGIPDYLDQQQGTAPGENVHANGVGYTKEDYLHWYMTYMDSLHVPFEVRERIAAKRAKQAIYRVFLKEFKSGVFISDEDIADLNSESDIKVIVDDKRNTIYTAGEFSSESQATERKNDLLAKGFTQAEVVVFQSDEMLSAQDYEKLSEQEVRMLNKDLIKQREKMEGLYAVRLGATAVNANSTRKAFFLKDPEVAVFPGERRSSDYVVGPFIDTVSARQIRNEKIDAGFNDAEIVRIEGGMVVPLHPKVNDEEEEGLPEDILAEIRSLTAVDQIDDFEKIKQLDGKLVVKVGTANRYLTEKEKAKLAKEPRLISITNPDQTVDYVYEVGYESKEEALRKRSQFEKKGYPQPLVARAAVKDQELKLILEEILDNKYTISLGSYQTGVKNDQVNKILSISDVKQLETFNPDVTHYTVGVFETKEAAKARMLDLATKGFKVDIIKYEENKVTKVKADQFLTAAEQKVITDGAAKINVETNNAVFRVQIGAFSTPVANSKFKGVDVIEMKGTNGIRKYLTEGKFEYRDAYIEKMRLVELGFSDAFVVAFKDGKKIPLKDLVNDDEYRSVQNEFSPTVVDAVETKTPTSTEQVASVPKGPIKYKVQVGAFKDFSAEHNKLRQYPDVEMEIYGEYKRIIVGSFDAYNQAAQFKDLLKSKGYPNAFVVAYQGESRMAAAGQDAKVISKNEGGAEPQPQPVKGLVIMIQVGLYRGEVPADIQAKFDLLPKVTKQVTAQGIIRYLTGEFTDPTEATAYKEELKSNGFDGAFLVAYYNSDRIDIEKAIEMFNANHPR